VLAAVFESLIGAMYLDAGLGPTRGFLLRMLGQRIEDAARSGHQSNFKSVLQQTAQQTMGMTPQYLLLDEKGPDHSKCFEVCVEIGSRRFGSCWGPSKKQAEQEAALSALHELGFVTRSENGEIHLTPAGARLAQPQNESAEPAQKQLVE
jgi:ribonuclease-3